MKRTKILRWKSATLAIVVVSTSFMSAIFALLPSEQAFAAAQTTQNYGVNVDASIKYGNTVPPTPTSFAVYAVTGDSAGAKATGSISLTGKNDAKSKTMTYSTGGLANQLLSGTITGVAGQDKFEVCATSLTKVDTGKICGEPWVMGDLNKQNVRYTMDLAGTYAGTAGTPAAGSTDGDKIDQSPTCSTNGDPLTYILCPIFNGFAALSDFLFQNIVQPFLLTTPIGTSNKDPVFQIWSNFRVYGDIFLVIAVLVVVIGQSIGGGLVDAYTAKKMLPRVLVAAILINLSIYIVAVLVDITNVIGRGLGDIMTAPLQKAGQWNFSPSAGQGLGVFGVGILGILLTGAAGVMTKLFFDVKKGNASALGGFTKIAVMAALAVVLPMVIALLAVFATLVIRKGLILFLVLVSPVAFALYCLPNTEQYFKKWWDLLLEALMIYPIIIAIFAIADILSVTVLSANGIKVQGGNFVASSIADITAVIIAFFLQFLPLLAIPFSFRIAGGALGKLYDAVSAGGQKVGGMAEGWRAEKKRDFAIQREQAQDYAHRYWRGRAGSQDMTRSRASRFLTGAPSRFMAARTASLGGRDIESVMAARRSETQKRISETTGNGDDELVRAATVDQNLRRLANRGAGALQASSYEAGKDYEIDKETGQVKVADLTGKMYGLGSANTAAGLFGGDHGALQANLTYAMGKGITQEQKDSIVGKFPALAASYGMSKGEAQGAWTGSAYAKANSDRDYKHYTLDKSGHLQMNGEAALIEANRTQSAYYLQQQSPEYFNSLSEQVKIAHQVVNEKKVVAGMDEKKAKVILSEGAKLASALESGSFSVAGMEGDGDDKKPVQAPAARGGGREIGAGAAADTAEAMKMFVATNKQYAGKFVSHADEHKPLETQDGTTVEIQGRTKEEELAARDRVGPGAKLF